MSGERASRSSLDLPGKQQQLLEAAVATGKPSVLVLLNARPLNITWASNMFLRSLTPGIPAPKAATPSPTSSPAMPTLEASFL